MHATLIFGQIDSFARQAGRLSPPSRVYSVKGEPWPGVPTDMTSSCGVDGREEIRMKRTILVNGLVHGLVYASLAATAVALGAQEANQSNPYQGTSNPPPDSTITTPAPETAPQNTSPAKPSPSHYTQPQSNVAPAAQAAPPPYAAETVPAPA